MNHALTLATLIARTRVVATLFDQRVGTWSPAIMMSELAAEVGTLADSVMIKEQHRPPRQNERIDLADDVADVLFMLVRIADYYEIDLPAAYERMLTLTQEHLEQRMLRGEGDPLILSDLASQQERGSSAGNRTN